MFSVSLFFQLGFLDGRIGLLYVLLRALTYRLLVDAKVVLAQQGIRSGAYSVEYGMRKLFDYDAKAR